MGEILIRMNLLKMRVFSSHSARIERPTLLISSASALRKIPKIVPSKKFFF